nr:biopolymer transporter ExbD [Leptolyngbya sp. FACHB-541]
MIFSCLAIAMKINLDSPAEEVRIEIIPLIDVIFCILTFFILAAVGLTRQAAIGVDLPSASTGTPQMREMLIVSIDPIGQVYVEQQPVTQDQLLGVILNYQQTSPDGLMVLYASREARYNDVVGVIDLLRSVGGDRVALATLPESAADTAVPGLVPDPGAIPNDPFGQPGLGAPGTTDPLAPNQDLFPGLEPFPSAPDGSGSLEPAPSTPQPATP